MAIQVSRDNVLGYRARAQGLERSGPTSNPASVDGLLGIGVQDTPAGTALTALAARGVAGLPAKTRIVWSWRGAPHVHRESDLKALASATWPLNDADATRRAGSSQIAAGAARGLEAFGQAAAALRAAVTEQLPKGEVSTLVSAAVPDDLTYDCPSCQARHISGGLFQLVGAAAGVEVRTEGRSTFLRPLPAALRLKQIPTQNSGLGALLLRYLRVNGPVSSGALGAHLGTTATEVKKLLALGLTDQKSGGEVVEVVTPVGKAWMPEDRVDDLLASERPEMVRLLPGGDPWLTVRDRELVLPDAEQHRQVYKALSNPGVVLADGDVVGTWRGKLGKGRALEVSVTSFGRTPARLAKEIEAEAQLLAPSRGAPEARVTFA